MEVFIAFTLLMFWACSLEARSDVDCCQAQKVGDFSYTLLPDDAQRDFPDDCHPKCAYSRDGQQGGPDYCFKPGSLKSFCVPKDNEVSCGNHVASSCDKCPEGKGSAWCNGKCAWKENNCVAKPSELCIEKGDPFGHNFTGNAPEYQKSIGGEECIMWSEVVAILNNHYIRWDYTDGINHNNCRNPSNSALTELWCFVGKGKAFENFRYCKQPPFCQGSK